MTDHLLEDTKLGLHNRLIAVDDLDFEVPPRKDSLVSSFIESAKFEGYLEGKKGSGMDISLLDKPHAEQQGQSPFQVIVNLFKCAVGSGSFNLPSAFKHGGLWLSFFSTCFLGFLSAFTINQLAWCERQLVSQLQAEGRHRSRLSYIEVGREAFPMLAFTVAGRRINIMAVIISIGIILTSIGVCGVYVIFVSKPFPDLTNGAISQLNATLIIFPLLVLMSWIRDFRYLSFTSVLGDVAVSAGLITVLAFGFVEHDMDWTLPAANVETFPKFFGGTAFLFAIHIVVLPLMQTMKEPSKFARATNVSYVFISVVNALFGAIGYMLFGDTVEGNVIDSLPKDSGVVIAVRILLAIDLFFTVPMVMSAARELIENGIYPHKLTPDSWKQCWVRNFIRTCLVALAVLFAYEVPHFDVALDLVGGFTNSLMGFIIPPAIYLMIKYKSQTLTWLNGIPNLLIMAFGFTALISTTTMTITNM